MNKIKLFLIFTLIILSGCQNKKTSIETNPQTNCEPQIITKVINEKEYPNKIECGILHNFKNYEWFKKLSNIYNKETSWELISENDDLHTTIKEGCIINQFFIFTPYEDIAGGGAFFSYNIENNTLQKSPQNDQYFAKNITGINQNYIEFISGAGSGECFNEKHGKYFYKENKVEIFKDCNFCFKSKPEEKDCKNILKTYQ